MFAFCGLRPGPRVGKWSWPDARVLLIGSLPGTLLGAVFFVAVNPDVIRVLIGAISLAFVAAMHLGRTLDAPVDQSPAPV